MNISLKKETEYLMTLPLIIAVMITGTEALLMLPVGKLDRNLFLIYLFIYFAIFILGIASDHEYFSYIICPILPLFRFLIFKDEHMLLNTILPLLIMAFLWLIRKLRLGKHLLSIYTLGSSVFWFSGSEVPKQVALSLFLLIIYALLLYAGLFFDHDFKEKYQVILFAIILTAVYFTPSSSEPMEWMGIRSVISKIERAFSDMFWQIEYAFDGLAGGDAIYSGYSETGLMTGGISFSDRDELYFSTLGSARSIYIKGRSHTKLGRNGFTGKEENPNIYNEQFAILANSLYHSSLSKEKINSFITPVWANVRYNYLRTSDILAPSNVIWLDITLRNRPGYIAQKGFSYGVRYLNIDYASPYFKELVSDAGASSGQISDYDTLSSYISETMGIDFPRVMTREEYEEAVSNASSYYDEKYLDTSMATDRIKNLTSKITAGLDNDYDKAKAIEKYLRQYTYDINCDLRGSENFVDSFLFEEQKGYCTYYASSMVLMLRLCDIPAKYSQGYLHSDNKTHMVRGKEAHAWPEAYIQGIGWVDFEPTSTMETAEQRSWSKTISTDTEAEKNDESSEDTQKEKEISSVKLPDSVTSSISAEEQAKKRQESLNNLKKYAAYLLMIAALVLIAYFTAIRLHYQRLDARKKVQTDMELLRRKLEKKYPVNAVSLYEYLDNVEDEAEKELLQKIFDRYYLIRFREDDPGEKYIRFLHNYSKKF
ncbi:MAG: transglutaminase domain-containing protein [Lachnospiraceae bacterium]|nr:transglutaminase domain-containing protein [Lachnospiraceae bacterium]